MDAIVVTCLTFILFFLYKAPPESVTDRQLNTQVTELNPTMNMSGRRDERAFMRIANELGFR